MLRNKTEGIFVRIPELINRVLSCNFKNTFVKYFKYLLENCYAVIYKLKTIISIFCDQYTTLISFMNWELYITHNRMKILQWLIYNCVYGIIPN